MNGEVVMQPKQARVLNAGRASMSFSDEEAAHLADLMTALVNGRDITRFRTSELTTGLLYKARRMHERASATAKFRTGRAHPGSVSSRALADLRANGPSSAQAIARRIGSGFKAVRSALTFHRINGNAERIGRAKWRATGHLATVTQLSERKVAVR